MDTREELARTLYDEHIEGPYIDLDVWAEVPADRRMRRRAAGPWIALEGEAP